MFIVGCGRSSPEAATPSWLVVAWPLQSRLAELGNPSGPPADEEALLEVPGWATGGADEEDAEDEASAMTGRLIGSGPGSKWLRCDSYLVSASYSETGSSMWSEGAWTSWYLFEPGGNSMR